VSITLVKVGPWGDGEAARGKATAAAGFAVGELAALPGFPAEASSRAAPRTLDAVTTTASTQ
jgi:hypothetical protein